MKASFLRLIAYLLIQLIPVVLLNASYNNVQSEAAKTVFSALWKKQRYLKDASDYSLVYFGDSRTLSNFHPDRLDPLLGTRSINLGAIAHWLPTQYPFLRDIIASIPKSSTVVWSIGHQNFSMVGKEITNNYPIAPYRSEYLSWGFTEEQLKSNLDYYNSTENTLTRRKAWNTWIKQSYSKSVGLASKADILSSETLLDEAGSPTSQDIKTKGGGELRVEINHEFFRKKQLEFSGKFTAEHCLGEEPYLKMFSEMLTLFRKNDINLIVNEVEEAPTSYADLQSRAACRDYMRRKIQPMVEAEGFPYIRVDWDRFGAADYFDYNHLNSDGVEKFSPLIAEKIRPYLVKE